jgi:hypothetical protein
MMASLAVTRQDVPKENNALVILIPKAVSLKVQITEAIPSSDVLGRAKQEYNAAHKANGAPAKAISPQKPKAVIPPWIAIATDASAKAATVTKRKNATARLEERSTPRGSAPAAYKDASMAAGATVSARPDHNPNAAMAKTTIATA